MTGGCFCATHRLGPPPPPLRGREPSSESSTAFRTGEGRGRPCGGRRASPCPPSTPLDAPICQGPNSPTPGEQWREWLKALLTGPGAIRSLVPKSWSRELSLTHKTDLRQKRANHDLLRTDRLREVPGRSHPPFPLAVSLHLLTEMPGEPPPSLELEL